MSIGPAKTRSDLLGLLTQACELEHGLACSYLFTAFTIRTEIEEGLTWQEQQTARRWAAQIFFVASQEMLHLAQAWNLLSAIGGTPYYLRPNFPQSARYYPIDTPLALQPFGRVSIQRFLRYERPQDLLDGRGHFDARSEASPPDGYHTVAELYSWIAEGFRTIPAGVLFVGDPRLQVGPDVVDFPDLLPVDGPLAAQEAIARVMHQGEGTTHDRLDCHFGIFYEILRQLESQPVKASHFSRDVVDNPTCHSEDGYGARQGTLLTDPYTWSVADLFDDLYGLMLRMLTYTFAVGAPGAIRSALATSALRMMVTVLKPLGESLTQLPAGNEHSGRRAGPPFGLVRHVTLPVAEDVARRVAGERLSDLLARARELAEDDRAPTRLQRAAQHLGGLVEEFLGR